MPRVVTQTYFVRMRPFLLTFDMIDILCLVYPNLCGNKMIYLKPVNVLRVRILNIIFLLKYEITGYKISIESKVNKNRRIPTNSKHLSQL